MDYSTHTLIDFSNKLRQKRVLRRRNPRLLLRLFGVLLLRFEKRVLTALLFQLPPRLEYRLHGRFEKNTPCKQRICNMKI